MTPLEKLQARWLRKFRSPMPGSIACLPLDRVSFAVRQMEAGNMVCVPGVAVKSKENGNESMVHWDTHGEF